MKKKNRAFYRYFIPVIYAVFVYILWELTGTLVAYVLMMDGISFRYTEETGIVFSAPDFYVKNLIRRLMSCYGVSLKPIINEFK